MGTPEKVFLFFFGGFLVYSGYFLGGMLLGCIEGRIMCAHWNPLLVIRLCQAGRQGVAGGGPQET